MTFQVGGPAGASWFCNSTTSCANQSDVNVIVSASRGSRNLGGSAIIGVEYSGGNGTFNNTCSSGFFGLAGGGPAGLNASCNISGVIIYGGGVGATGLIVITYLGTSCI